MAQFPYATHLARPKRAQRARSAGFGATAYALGAAMFGTTLPTPLYALYRSRFGFSELMVTVVFATYAFGVVAALLLAGRLSDRLGRRRVLLVGIAFSAAGAVAFLASSGVGMLIFGRVLSGISAGIFTGTATAALLDLAPSGAPGRASVVAAGANMGGLGLGALLAGLLAQFVGAPLQIVFLLDLIVLVPAAALIWAMPEPAIARASSVPRHHWLPGVPRETRAAFGRVVPPVFAGFAVLGLFTAVAPAFIGQIIGVDSTAIVGLVVFAVFAASSLGQLVLARVVESRALEAGSIGLVVGMALLALGLASSSLMLILVGGIVAGLGQGTTFRVGLASVNDAAPPARRAEVASSFFVVAYVAISLPVVGVGLLAQVTGLRAAGLLFTAAVAALAAAASARATNTHPETEGGRA